MVKNMNKFNKMIAISIGAVISNGVFAVLSTPGSGNGYGQPCGGQNTYGAGPCYPTAYVPTFKAAVTAANAFNQNLQPDYYGSSPNYANSPQPTLNADGTISGGLHKFVDDLPQIGKSNVNGMELVVATPDTTTYGGATVVAQPADGIEYASDYYEIGVVQYSIKMHSELPPTTLRGYVQLETPMVIAALNAAGTPSQHIALTYPNGSAIKDLAGNQVYAVAPPNYLGPSVVATKNKPVRVKFTNYLPVGVDGNLPFPVDDTYMGAGKEFSQNRITVHLHGGATPWISDGTPHQWTSPVGETNVNKRGPAVKFVPDMWFDAQGNTIDTCAAQLVCSVAGATNDPGQGSLTMYYTNQQSAKFMFYHDHAYGLTRLNVYGGMAAGYILKDPVEDDLINGTNNSGGNPGLAQLPDGIGIPLVIQDKTWVDPANIINQDPTWAWGSKPATASTPAIPTAGDLWLPHVYMPNQHPTSVSGVNDLGRWDYNTWIYPPITTQIIGPVPNLSYIDALTTPNEPPLVPGTTNPTGTPESFMDSVTVNGTAWPKLSVTPSTHRFKLLNAADDRTLSLNWFIADPIGLTVISGGKNYTAPTVTLSGGWKSGTGTPAQVNAITSGVVDSITVTSTVDPGYISEPTVVLHGGGGTGAQAIAILDPTQPSGLLVQVTNGGRGYTSAPSVEFNGVPGTQPIAIATITNMIVDTKTVVNAVPPYDTAPTVTVTDVTGTGATMLASPNTEINMVPAMLSPAYPLTWPADGRNGGAPDPAAIGPQFTILANEGGWLPKPQTLKTQPVTYEQSRRVIFTLNVKEHGLVVGPAERFDAIVDFSNYAGQTILLYNDAPAPYPAFDERYDYYTGSPDNTFQGGAPTVLPGYGPNTRTVMQVNVCDTNVTDSTSIYFCDPIKTVGVGAPVFDITKLNKSWTAVYANAQEKPLVPTSVYNNVLGGKIPDQKPNLADMFFTFKPWDPTTNALSTSNVTIPIQEKAIVENWDMEYGRLNALLGAVLPNTGPSAGAAMPYSYFNPPTEIMQPTFQPYPMVGTLGDGTQIWRLDHQGIDQHYIHFHLFNLQLIGRVAIDGTAQAIDPEEQGLKEVIRMSPTLDTFVAARPVQPYLPWKLPNSVRPLDPSVPVNATMTDSNGTTLTNVMTDYGMEYVWHCHLLGHEEHDMMRPIVMVMPLTINAPVLPAGVKGTAYTPTTFGASGGLTNTVTNGLPYRFTITGGTLPTGLTMTTAGTISGTPSAIGTFNFNVSATDSSTPAKTVSLPQTITIGASALVPSVMTLSIPNGNVGNTYNQNIVVAGGTGPYTWTSTGTVPTGLIFSNGVLSGTPTTVGNFSFSVTVTDSKNVKSAAQAYVVSISTTNLATAVLPNSNVGVLYSQPLNVSGGISPYSWLTTGTVPPGLTVTNGLISGTPTTAGVYNFNVTATDSANPLPTSSSKTYNVTIGASLTPSIATASLPGGMIGTAYNQTVSVIGGTAPYTWLTTGTIPTGLTFVNGILSGNPTVPGTYNFSTSVIDSKNVSSAPQAYSVTIGGTLLNGITNLTAYVSTSTGTKVTGETLTWTNTSVGSVTYKVEYASSTTNVWTVLPGTQTGTTTMSFTSTLALAKNVTYSFRVTPLNGSTTGAVSNIAVIDMKLKPVAPVSLIASSGTIGTPYTIGLIWTDVANNNTGYTVQKCKANTPAQVASCTAGKGWSTAKVSGAILGPNTVVANVSGLSKNTNYMLRVSAKNAIGNGVASVPTVPTLAQ